MTVPARRRRGREPAYRSPSAWMRDPLVQFDDLLTQLGNLMESAFGESVTTAAGWVPPAEVSEADDAFIVEVELPGVSSEDINVEVHGQELVVSGEARPRERKGTVRQSTRRVGRFEYRVILPGELNTKDVSAGLDDGVLAITVPKAEATKPRRVEIAHGARRTEEETGD
jgi:HSP20 family protein